jgi:hypothetical protein
LPSILVQTFENKGSMKSNFGKCRRFATVKPLFMLPAGLRNHRILAKK